MQVSILTIHRRRRVFRPGVMVGVGGLRIDLALKYAQLNVNEIVYGLDVPSKALWSAELEGADYYVAQAKSRSSVPPV